MPANPSRTLAFSTLAATLWLAGGQTALSGQPDNATPTAEAEAGMAIQYLEIVTPDAEAAIATLEATHGVEFGDPEPGFGHARIARLSDGGRLGVRAPLSDEEGAPVVRPYLRVEDMQAAIEAAQAGGAEFAMLATEIPGHGAFAIYFQGGIQYGLWALPGDQE